MQKMQICLVITKFCSSLYLLLGLFILPFNAIAQPSINKNYDLYQGVLWAGSDAWPSKQVPSVNDFISSDIKSLRVRSVANQKKRLF